MKIEEEVSREKSAEISLEKVEDIQKNMSYNITSTTRSGGACRRCATASQGWF
jgi:hypothetical protein